MAKKKLRKPVAKRQKGGIVVSRVKIVFFVVAILMVGLITRSVVTADHYKVLGTSTFLARGGDESGGSDSGGSGSGSSSSGGGSESSGSGSSDSGSSGGGSSESGSGSSGFGGGSSESSGGSDTSNVSENTTVTCTGPDGKQFQASFKACEELNKAWNKPVRFTASESEKPEAIESPEAPEIENEIEAKKASEEAEIEVPEVERIRTLTKDGNFRLDITSGKIKTRFEIKDDKVVVKAEQADGTDVELAEESLAKIDDRLEKDNIKVATAGASKFLVQKGTVGAVTDFPVSVDLATNTLFVNMPNGQKEIAVLPEQAIQNIIKAKIISSLGDKPAVAGANTNVTSVGQLVILGEKNGIPVYEINGVSDQKLLGFIPVKVQKDIVVSGQTGNALSIDQSFGARIIDALSF